MKAARLLFLILLLPGLCVAQGTNAVFPAQTFYASGQTGQTINLNGSVGSGFNTATVTVTGVNLSTVTFQIMGSGDNATSFYQLPVIPLSSPISAPVTTVTATANGIYQVSLGGVTHLKFVTSGTFTATSVSLVLSASPLGGASTGANTFTGAQTAPVINNVYYALPGIAGSLQAQITAAIASGIPAKVVAIGNYTITSGITIPGSNITLEGVGGVITCNVVPCVTIGGSPSTSYNNNVLRNLTFSPGAQLAGSMIADDSYGTIIENLQMVAHGTNYFYHLVQPQDDERLVITDTYINAQVLRCDSTFCGTMLYSPGTGGDASVLYLSNSTLDPECQGNGLEWDSGNDVHLSSVVIQAYSQFGELYNPGTVYDGRVLRDKVHNEPSGTCTNPALPRNDGSGLNLHASAGLISNAVSVVSHHGALGGWIPQFPFATCTVGTPAGNTCSTNYAYYVVANNSGGTLQTTPMQIGYVTSAPSILSSSNAIYVTWPSIPTAGTCDLLRVNQTTGGYVAPYFGNALAVQTGISCSSGSSTTVTDITPDGSLAAYTGLGSNKTYGGFVPVLTNWPGSVVLANKGVFSGQCGFENLIVSQYINNIPTVLCNESGVLPGGGIANTSTQVEGQTSATISQMGINIVNGPAATTMMEGQAQYTSTYWSGVLNLGNFNSAGLTDLITLFDSQYYKTMATPGNRRSGASGADGDAAIATDGSAYSSIALRSPVSISSYINHTSDNSSWLERLTASAKTFKVPVIMPTGSTAVTQANGDQSTAVATDQFVINNSGGLVASNIVTGQTASVSFFTVYTPSTAGRYELCGGAQVTSAGSTGATLTTQAAWNTHGPTLGTASAVATAVGNDTGSITNPCTTFLWSSGPIQIEYTIGGAPTTPPTFTYWYAVTKK